MNLYKQYLLLLFILTSSLVNSQINFESLTTLTTGNSHLLGNYINCIKQDFQGNMWIQCPIDLAKFNGQNWEFITGNNAPLFKSGFSYEIDALGNLWINNGWDQVKKFDGNTWTSYTDTLFFYMNNWESCADNSGNVYFPTMSSGIAKFNDTSYTFMNNLNSGLLNNSVYCVFINSQNVMYIGHSSGGVTIIDSTGTSYLNSNNLFGTTVFDICEDSNGNMWFASDSGLTKFDGIIYTSYNPSNIFGVINSSVKRLSADHSGGVWCTSISQGVYYYDGIHWNHFYDGVGLNSNWINTICCDDQNKIWIGTADLGIDIYDFQSWSYMSTCNNGMLNNQINGADRNADGSIWFTTDHGLIEWTGNQWINHKFKRGGSPFQWPEPEHYSMYSVDEGSTGLWFGGGLGYGKFGAASLIDTNWTEYFSISAWSVLGRPVYQSLQESDSVIWFATKYALNRMKIEANSDPSWTTYQTSNGLLNNKVTSLVFDSNQNLIIGTWGGINKLTNDTISIIPMNDVFDLIGNQVNSLIIDKQGILWVGTTQGVGVYNGQAWQAYSTTDGLADNYINKIFEASDSSVWLGTMNGISRYKNGMFTSWYKADGLIADKVNDITEDQNQILYFATDYGVSKLALSSLDVEATIKLKSNNLKLYPNPASNKLYFKSHDSGIVKIFSLSGQVLLETNMLPGQNQVDITSLQPGNYLLQAVGNKKSRVGRFVVLR